MKSMPAIRYLLLLIPFLQNTFATGQNISPDIISTAGSLFTKDNITLQWTMGEIIIDQYQDGNPATGLGFHAVFDDNTATSSPDRNWLARVKIFPNPVDDQLHVITDQLARFSIYNGLQLVAENKNYNRTWEINLSDLPGGFYWIALINKKGERITGSFVKH